jgi:heme-degrading monooxygenase HmoA
MPSVLIRHKVASYAKWKSAVKAFKGFRKASGEQCFCACRSAKNPNDVTVYCTWDTMAHLKKFIKSPELRKAMKDAGVISKPEINIFKKMEDLSVG